MNRKKWTHRTPEEKAIIVKNIQERIQQGTVAPEACKEYQVATTQFYRWRSEALGKPDGVARQIKPKNGNNERVLRIENQRLKMIVAEQALDIQALKEWSAR